MVLMYQSTRGNSPKVPFSEVVLAGLAPDGGLYVPTSFPYIRNGVVKDFSAKDYKQVAYHIMRLLADDMPPMPLWNLVQQAYTKEKFSFGVRPNSKSDAVAVHELANGFWIGELSNGPTWAFKDMALQLVGLLMQYCLKGKTVNIVVATSGDTGSASIKAFANIPGINLFVLSPRGQMSDIQTAQMYTELADNIFNIAIDGTFDDCQRIVKALFGHPSGFREKYKLSVVNSINWARIAAQIAYYFFIYSRIDDGSGKQIDFAVPSGNFGNAYAAFAARQMGLPIGNIVIGTNVNDVLHRFIQTGEYKVGGEKTTTSSPSMDILEASNLERLLFDIYKQDTAFIIGLYRMLAEDGKFGGVPMKEELARRRFLSSSVTEESCWGEINRAYRMYSTVIDPHTAVAARAAIEHKRSNVDMVILETAQPAKFPDVIQNVLELNPQIPTGYEDLLRREQRCKQLPADANEVMEYIKSVV